MYGDPINWHEFASGRQERSKTIPGSGDRCGTRAQVDLQIPELRNGKELVVGVEINPRIDQVLIDSASVAPPWRISRLTRVGQRAAVADADELMIARDINHREGSSGLAGLEERDE